MDPAILTVLAEIGVSVDTAFPKPLTDEVVQDADIIVTMGCGDACAILPGKRYYDWDIADPDDASLDLVRTIRDEINQHIQQLITDITPVKEPA